MLVNNLYWLLKLFLLLVTLITFFIRPGLLSSLSKLLVACLAIFVVSILQFHDLALLFLWIVTLAAFFDRVSLFPHVLAILIIMMALRASDSILVMVLFVGEFYRALFVRFITGVLD